MVAEIGKSRRTRVRVFEGGVKECSSPGALHIDLLLDRSIGSIGEGGAGDSSEMPEVVAEGISALSLEEARMSVEAAEEVVLRWDSKEEMVWESLAEESQVYLDAVDVLLGSTDGSNGRTLNLAAKRLKNEFKNLLACHSECVDPNWLPESFSAPSFNSTTEDDDSSAEFHQQQSIPREQQPCLIDLIPPGIVADLADISSRMVALGRADDCTEDFVLIRRGVLEGSMVSLGVEKVSREEIHRMQWDVLAPRLKKWTKALKATLRVLFPSEKSLCTDVFDSVPDLGQSCFTQVVTESALDMLQLFEDVSLCPESPDRLFPLLDLYEAHRDSMAVVEDTFRGGTEVDNQAAHVLHLMSNAVKAAFFALKYAIEHNSSRTPAPLGALHPMTRFVMNSLGLLSEYLPTLKEIYGDVDTNDRVRNGGEPGAGAEPEPGDDNDRPESALQSEVMRVLEALVQNLEEHAKLYPQAALGKVFLMNNTHYIVQKLKALEQQAVVKTDWIRKLNSTVRFHTISYQREAWNRVFNFLKDEGIRTGYSNVSKDVLKERFRNFNAAVEDIHRTQSVWVIADAGFRNEVRVLIADKLLPAYRSFLGRYRVHMESIRHHERYLKYTDDDLENILNDLFEGANSMGRRRSLSGSG